MVMLKTRGFYQSDTRRIIVIWSKFHFQSTFFDSKSTYVCSIISTRKDKTNWTRGVEDELHCYPRSVDYNFLKVLVECASPIDIKLVTGAIGIDRI